MSALVRNLGTTPLFHPQQKRAVAKHGTTGNSYMVSVDTNRTGTAGDDTSGAAKIFVYRSTDATRTAWTFDQQYTPPVAPASSTKRAMLSFAMNSNNDIFVAWQGTDNSVNLTTFVWSVPSQIYGLGTTQTILATNAVTDRIRAIDIDVANSTNGNPAVIIYESSASSGVGAFVRVYIRLNDGTTWRKAYETQIQTSGTILAGSEDVSISWGADGIVTNVGRLAIYYTQTSTTADSGDFVREIDFNVSTGTDGSATTIVTWASAMNQNVAAGSRRAWLFKNKVVGGTACWVLGGAVGLTSPYYFGMKLHHNTASPVINKTANAPAQVTTGKFGVFTASDRGAWAAVSASFSDQRLVMSFIGTSPASFSNAMRGAVLRWDDSVEGDSCVSIDSVARVLDNNYSVLDGSLAIYGGANQLSVGNFEYTEMAWYGAGGNSVSATVGVLARYARAIIEDVAAAPSITQPSALSTVATGTPTFQVYSQSSLFWHFMRGRVQLQFASDSGFTTSLTTTEETGAYRIYESPNGGTSGVSYYVSYTLPNAVRRTTGTWYVRARIADDLGGLSAYGSGVQFAVSHPPAVVPVQPSNNSSIGFYAGDITFTWNLSDPDANDTQTAYNIVLTRLDTGATVTDTGKVVSGNKSGIITVATSLKDVPLSWKVRLWDGDDNVGAFCSPQTFTASDAPVAVITSPTVGGTVTSPAPTVTWTFAAGGTRIQTHYRIIIIDTTAGPPVRIVDTGYLPGAATSYTFLSPILKPSNNYRISVSVRDSAGLTATSESNLLGNPGFDAGTTTSWTPTNCTFTASTAQKRTGVYSGLITPPGAVAPSVQSVSYPATTGHSYVAAGYVWSAIGWTSATITIDWRDAGDLSLGTSTTTLAIGASVWTLLSVTATAPASTVKARVTVAMTGVPAATDLLYVDDLSFTHALGDFSTNLTPPAVGNTSVATDTFKATISWTNVNQDSGFIAWRVYRRYNKAASVNLDVDNTRNTWVLIYETTVAQSSYSYLDYFAPLNKATDYMVTQVADRFGSTVESAISGSVTVTIAGDRYYFVPAIPIGTIASFEANSVTDDSFQREVEQETLHVIGRGRQVQVGDDIGYAGTLQLKLRNIATARSDREFIELLSKSTNGATYIRSPFGDVWYVRFGTPTFSRMAGVGIADLGDLSVPYTEVYTDVPVTRTV